MSAATSNARNIGKYFIRSDVQAILKNLIGFDLQKIYRTGFNKTLQDSKMELLNEQQLKKEMDIAIEKAQKLLQIPPVLQAREKLEITISNDERLDPLNLKNTSYVFTDISLNVPDKKRLIVVRESTGRLRKANHEEREKMLQIYFPKEGKSFVTPRMFEPLNLEECLKLKNYIIVLKKACITYEPDDPEFMRITNRVYNYVNENKDFDHLYSTRFFGSMAFYLSWHRKIENLVEWYLQQQQLEKCVELMHLYEILEIEEKSQKTSTTFEMPNDRTSQLLFIERFIKNHLKGIKTIQKVYDWVKSQ